MEAGNDIGQKITFPSRAAMMGYTAQSYTGAIRKLYGNPATECPHFFQPSPLTRWETHRSGNPGENIRKSQKYIMLSKRKRKSVAVLCVSLT